MRQAKIARKTAETEIEAAICLDGEGKSQIDTGIGFFDHMLTLFSKHGLFDTEIRCVGDLRVDGHHTVEDVGIVLGRAVAGALGDKAGIKRYGACYTPMDETLGFVSLDISGRPYLVFDAGELAPMIGDFDSQLAEEFLRAFSAHAGITLHARILYGKNSHHKIEAIFKSLGRALGEAARKDPRILGVMSTKGAL